MKAKTSVTLLTIAAVALTVLLASCSLPYRWVSGPAPGSYDSNGERIYFTAKSNSGEAITYSGGVPMMMRQRLACVSCHGPEGRGGRVNMMMWSFETPDITWDALTGAEHEEPGGEAHEEHPPYTEDTLKRAITRGLDPAREPLDDNMPRWRMSEEDLNDLVEFIKTLD
ncbi:MAG: cytochrome c [Chloroflexota bacterium]